MDYAEEGIRTPEPTKGTALEAVAFDHFATSALEEEINWRFIKVMTF